MLSRTVDARALIDILKEVFPEMEPTEGTDGWVELNVKPSELTGIARTLRDDERLKFNYLSCLSGVDLQDKGFRVVINLLSLHTLAKLTLKIDLPKDKPVLPSVTPIWPGANWHEREAWDLLGIQFKDHPDLRRILMKQDWEGHPLRKDYVDKRPPRDTVIKKEDYLSSTACDRTSEVKKVG